MSGGSFLVSLRDVYNSERILACRSLIKENINFWEEDLREGNNDNKFDALLEEISSYSSEIMEGSLNDEN